MIRSKWEPGIIYDQGKGETCTGHAWAAACRAVWGEDSPSPKDLYTAGWIWQSKLLKSSFDPYTYAKEGLMLKAPAEVLKDEGLIHSYDYVFSLQRMIWELQYGPVLIALPWFRGFACTRDRQMSLWGEPDGFHAAVVLGHTTAGSIIQNSHGRPWGEDGRSYLSDRNMDAIMRSPHPRIRGHAIAVDWKR